MISCEARDNHEIQPPCPQDIHISLLRLLVYDVVHHFTPPVRGRPPLELGLGLASDTRNPPRSDNPRLWYLSQGEGLSVIFVTIPVRKPLLPTVLRPQYSYPCPAARKVRDSPR